ncbi:DUF5317 family protein [Clostridium sp.]|uniref:DUF5317 family protein n=1 Tax=Clostridium sp. TaxID=1506 RepID=UPI002FCC97CE
MFILALIGAIIIGYLMKGNIQNLSNITLKGMYLIGIAFFIEFIIILLINKGIINPSINTYIANIIMYLFIFTFIFINKKNPYIVLMGVGFFLNAIAIFSNSGTMPVSGQAIEAIGFSPNVQGEGLYNIINSQTNLRFLGDIIPLDFIGRFIVSIGDILSAIGMMLFIITSMKKQQKID